MRVSVILLAAAVFLAGGEHSTQRAEPGDPAFHHAPGHINALVERAWGENQIRELVKPGPPGIGAPLEKAIHLYVIAPVIPATPLSPPIEVPAGHDPGAVRMRHPGRAR